MPDIRCTVSNCEYWRENNWCGARQILVTSGKPNVENHHGEGAEHTAQTPVKVAEDSYCYTFEAEEG